MTEPLRPSPETLQLAEEQKGVVGPPLPEPQPSTEIVLAPAGATPALVSDDEWQQLTRIAQTVANTEFVPRGLRGNAMKTMACLLYGHAQGVNPMVALTELYIVDGKVGMSAAFIVGKIRGAGHKVSREAHVDESGDVVGITAHGERKDGTQDSFTFTLKMAERADLLKGLNWQKYPEAMLWARAVAQLGRMLFSDVFLGQAIYDREELVETEVIDVEAREAEESTDLLSENPLLVAWDVHSAAEARVHLRSLNEAELEKARELEGQRKKSRKVILGDIEERLANLRGSAPPDPQAGEDAEAGQGAVSDDSSAAVEEERGAGEEHPEGEAPTPADEDGQEATGDRPVLVDDEERPEIVRLRAYIERVREKHPLRVVPWEEPQLVQTATRVFKREIASFADMTDEEIGKISAALPADLRKEVDAELEEA